MANYIPRTGVGHVPSYQISGIPYATSSFTVPTLGNAPVQISFPLVSKFVTVVNTNSGSNAPLRVGFSVNGITGSSTTNYFTLDNGDSYTGEWRVESIYILSDSIDNQSSASVIAGLTGIMSGSIMGLRLGTTNWSGSEGVG